MNDAVVQDGARGPGRRWPAPDAVAAFCLGAIPVAALGYADGGFHPRPWGWATLGLAWSIVVAVLIGPSMPVVLETLKISPAGRDVQRGVESTSSSFATCKDTRNLA